MPEICPLKNCKFNQVGQCLNEDLKNVKNNVLAAKQGASDCIDCFEPRC
ncbi:MAG: hypothetical protein AB1420_06295 [Bacillota bacterium]